MTRKEVKVSVKMRTNGNIYVHPNILGDIIVYEDQIIAINNKISKCRTREEAKDIIRDFGCGLDLHHSDVQNPTIRRKAQRQPQRTSIVQRKLPAHSYTPPINSTGRVQTQSNRLSKKPMETQVRINDNTGIQELE
jgi:hypothetical protein